MRPHLKLIAAALLVVVVLAGFNPRVVEAVKNSFSDMVQLLDGVALGFGGVDKTVDPDFRLYYDEAGQDRLELDDGTNVLLHFTDQGTTGDLHVTGDISTGAGEAGKVAVFGDDKELTPSTYTSAQVATAVQHTLMQTFLATGGATWSGSGLVFNVTACTGFIQGEYFESPADTVTLDAADGTNPRIDAIVIQYSGSGVGAATKITGTPAADPARPNIDLTQYVDVTFVLVDTSATEPEVTEEQIYFEGAEWTDTASGAEFTLESTNDPHSGTKSIEATAADTADYVNFASANFDPSSYDVLSFHIKVKAAWVNKRLWIYWRTNGAVNGVAAIIDTGNYGFDPTDTSGYQHIVIPMAVFSLTNTTEVDELRIEVKGAGAAIGFFLDELHLQSGISTTTPSIGIATVAGDTGTFTATEPEDSVTIAGGTGISTAVSGDTVTVTADLGDSIDISSETNLSATAPLTLTGDTVLIDTTGASTDDVLTYDGADVVWQAAGGGSIDGSGATNAYALWSDTDTLTTGNLNHTTNGIEVLKSGAGAEIEIERTSSSTSRWKIVASANNLTIEDWSSGSAEVVATFGGLLNIMTTTDLSNTDDFATVDATISGAFYTAEQITGTTLSADAFTATSSFVTLSSQSGSADNCATINGGSDGMRITLMAALLQTITVKDGTGNIDCAGDFAMSGNDTISLIFKGGITNTWLETGRSNN